MPMHNKGLTKLTEECGELVQIAAKKATCIDLELHFDGEPMTPRLEDEIGDVMAASRFVMEKFNLSKRAINERYEMKLALYRKWDKEDA